MKRIATFSIVAYNPNLQEWGVAVQSKFLAAAAVVSWARANAGAIATQSFANVQYGIQGLNMLEKGKSAAEVVDALTRADDNKANRQVGIVDRNGKAAAFTGNECMDWAGHIVGDGFACQGNILIPGTIEAMAQRYESLRGKEGELADWLVETLQAGLDAGGDRRGRQAAGVLVVRPNGGYGGNNDRYIDLRVDDDPEPVDKLRRLVELHRLYFGSPRPEDMIPISTVTAELQRILLKAGMIHKPPNGIFDQQTRNALRILVGMENLEDRWGGEGDQIDQVVVDFLRKKFLEA